jgi:TolA-binding protein
MSAYGARRYGEAADELSAFVRSPAAPQHLVPAGIHNLARSLRSMGNLGASSRYYEDLLRRFPSYGDRSQALLEAAQVQMRLGNYGRAESLLAELERRPGGATMAQRERAVMEQRQAGERAPAGPASAVDAVEQMPTAAEAASGD